MRPGTVEDVDMILGMMVDYYEENQRIKPYDLDFNPELARQYLTAALQLPSYISYVSDNGIISGDMRRTWFGDNYFGQGGDFYVRPPARNGILARNLFNAFRDEVKRRGGKFCMFTMFNDVSQDMFHGWMKKFGCQFQGGVYYLKLD